MGLLTADRNGGGVDVLWGVLAQNSYCFPSLNRDMLWLLTGPG